MLDSLFDLIRKHYDQGISDYSLPPLVKRSHDGRVVGRVGDGDVLVFACRRGEREIQLTEAFVDPNFPHFERTYLPNLAFFPMVEYHSKFAAYPPLFSTTRPEKTLGEVLTQHSLKQLRIAESEKFPHVTYFFNGRREASFPGEERIKIMSTALERMKFVEHSTDEVGKMLISRMNAADFDFALVNFAAGDLYGHLPAFQLHVRCAEAVDRVLGQIAAHGEQLSYCLLITADHGLLEQAYNSDGSASVGHTRAMVPFILVDPTVPGTLSLAPDGTLADVAPTVLQIMGLRQPEQMTGKPLVQPYVSSARGVILIILDGWGIGTEDAKINPICAARTPHLNRLLAQYPHTALHASGAQVGLAPHSSGNSETGHLTLGAGRVVVQDEVRIPQNLNAQQLMKNRRFYQTIKQLGSHQAVHLLFLLSPGSSHGSTDEAVKLLAVLKEWEVERVYLHAITDGRSAHPFGAVEYLTKLQEILDQAEIGEVVTICGREFMLDRSGWYLQRTKAAYEALVDGKGLYWSRKTEQQFE